MLSSSNISHVFVFDQQKALDFYVGKLGLEVSNGLDLGAMRWLTVRVPGDPSRDIPLEVAGPPGMDQKAAEQVRELVSKGASGFARLHHERREEDLRNAQSQGCGDRGRA